VVHGKKLTKKEKNLTEVRNIMKKWFILRTLCAQLLFATFFPTPLHAQPVHTRDTILVAAHEIINETTFCGLVTIDSAGQPQVRTMNPFPVKNDFVVWFATARSSRKVREIRKNPKVSVYFADHGAAKGYVTVSGKAEVIDDKPLLMKMKRDYWKNIPDWENKFVLIQIVPKTMEVINYKHGINNDPMTQRAPTINF
jgi:general stress protein 26